MIQLYDYQNNTINGITQLFKTGVKKIVLCAPTGAGKTIMFTFMIAKAVERNKKILVLTHRAELLIQANGSFKKFNLDPELIKANEKPNLNAPLHIAMVETINRRLKKPEYLEFLRSRDLIIIDEAHLQNFDKLFSYFGENTFVIGATATPIRTGKQTSLKEFYGGIVNEVSIGSLISDGYLVEPKTYGVELTDINKVKKTGGDFDAKAMGDFYEENKIYNGVLSNFERLCKGRKTIVFTSNISSSESMNFQFNKSGYKSEHIDGTTPPKERQRILKWFSDTPDAIICNCGVLTTGFDQPDIGAVILYRATTSLPLFLQMVGRGGRKFEGKKDFFVLDFGENIKRHGFWEDERKWTLDKKKKSDKEGAAPIKDCKECGFMLPVSVMECPNCGHIFKTKEAEAPEEVELKKLKKHSLGINKNLLDLTPRELIKAQENNVIKHTFAWRVARSNGTKFLKEYQTAKGYKNGWFIRQLNEPVTKIKNIFIN